MPDEKQDNEQVEPVTDTDTDTDNGTATATKSAPVEKRPDRKVEKLPPYKVLLHNDDVNTVDHVVHSIVRITSLQVEAAAVKTLEAHERGVALLLVTHRERAELIQEQFTSASLTVTIEPDAG